MSKIILDETTAPVAGETGKRKLVARAGGFREVDPAGNETLISGTAAVAVHEEKLDPHPQYATTAEAAAAAPIQAVNVSGPLQSTGGASPTLSIPAATPLAAGHMAAADKLKLDGIATGATANDTDANLKSRANHTGEQAIGTVTGLATALGSKIESTEKGAANGVATLGADAKIPTSQLPDAILGALKYQGTWNAATNTPAIPLAADANKGHYYIVSVAGTTSINGEADWNIGDWIVSSGTTWGKVDNSDKVSSVNGKAGALTLTAADVGADPSGTASAAVAAHEAAADPHVQYAKESGANFTGPVSVTREVDNALVVASTGTGTGASQVLKNGDGVTSAKYSYTRYWNNDANSQDWRVGTYGTDDLSVHDAKSGNTVGRWNASGYNGAIGQTTRNAGSFTQVVANRSTAAPGYDLTVASIAYMGGTAATDTTMRYGVLSADNTYWQSVSNDGSTPKGIVFMGNAEYGRFDNNGNWLVGVTGWNHHYLRKSTIEGNNVLQVEGTTSRTALFLSVNVEDFAGAACGMYIGKNSTTGRSINAGGTVNGSGADQAEYYKKTEGCGIIGKGQIVGVDANGHVTDKWVDSVSFLIKSTDPYIVGGDVWGSEKALGLSRPVEPQFTPPGYAGAAHPGDAPVAPQVPAEDADEEALAAYAAAMEAHEAAAAAYDSALSTYNLDQQAHAATVDIAKQIFDTATYPTYLQQKATFEAALEAARQKVDRMAFSGQVPVNVIGAVPGQYVVPAQAGDGIGGMLVNDADITFAEYRRAVGVVQNILPDGRANVRVKVA